MQTRGLLILALFAMHAGSSATIAQQPPNLIFILADDQGVESIEGLYWPNQMGCFSQNLSDFAAQGVSFTNCRVNPNCSPSRGAIMTGRSALDTGVHGVIGRYAGANPCIGTPLTGTPADVTDRLSLQNQERSIAEVLQEMGYYTILVDKWHLGYDQGTDRDLLPTDQGFDEFYDWFGPECDICDGYPTTFYADHHMVCMAQQARDAVNDRPDLQQPYALFYHTITPHSRHNDDPLDPPNGYLWWDIEDQTLIPESVMSGLHANPSNTNRFIMNVEALDSVLVRDLLGPPPSGLGVVDDVTNAYNAASDTVVVFTADNGTDKRVSSFGQTRAKNSMYEGGIKVPLVVFGENITGTPIENTEDPRHVSHVDFFDTICDIVRAPDGVRNNPSGLAETHYPRRSMSFADAINWEDPNRPPPVERTVTVSSFGNTDAAENQVWQVAMIDDDYKLICNSAGPGAFDMSADEFYDLLADPPEQTNLVDTVMSTTQLTKYYSMRDRLVDEFATAVAVAQPPPPLEYTVDHFNPNMRYVLVAHLVWDAGLGQHVYDDLLDEFYDLQVDPDRDDDLLLGQMTQLEQAIYDLLHDEMEVLVSNGEASPDIALIDVPLQMTLVQSSIEGVIVTGPLTIGHRDVDNQYNEAQEYRALLKFDLSSVSLPPGFTPLDIVDAQIVIGFDHDSQLFDPNQPSLNDFMTRDADTGVIRIHRMLEPWTSDLWDPANYGDDELGRFDPPPHIIAIPFAPGQLQGIETKIRVLPMPSGTPISFGHSADLLQTVKDWDAGHANHGVILIADQLTWLQTAGAPSGLQGDQHLHFLRAAQAIALRLTLDRGP